MKRREFFRFGARKAAEAALEVAGQGAASEIVRHFRPPYALAEPAFLKVCSRCDDCLKACPHDVIFKLAADRGLLAEGTPALDLLNTACRMCEDWPCVAACETGALALPETADDEAPPPPPAMAKVTINTESCLPYAGPECGACAGSCPVPGALEWQGARPVTNQDACTGCAFCREACITDPKSVDIAVLEQD